MSQAQPELDTSYEEALEFCNKYRELTGLPTLAELPDATGWMASQNSIGLALNLPVVRHGAGGLLYALTRDSEVATRLVSAGARTGSICNASTREPEAGKIYEIALPRFCYFYAAPSERRIPT